jgi:hypothetical protein
MAHTCPECGCLCHCGGDIDDIDFGDDCEGAMSCHHYQQPECAGYEDHDFDYFEDMETPFPTAPEPKP